MWRAFRVSGVDGGTGDRVRFAERIRQVERSRKVAASLESFVAADGVLLGDVMQRTWFPPVPADVFVSLTGRHLRDE